MRAARLASLTAAALLFGSIAATQAATYQVIDLVSPNESLYAMTNGTSYPGAGTYLASDGIPYRIGAPNANDHNIWHSTVVNATTQVYELPVGVFGATEVYTLMNLWYGTNGHVVARVDFFGSAGAVYGRDLVVGTDIRDHYDGAYSNTINGTTTLQVFSADGVRLDRQTFALPGSFATQTLDRMVVTNLTDPFDFPLGQAFLASVTVAAVPEPATFALLLAGLGLVGWRMRLRSSPGRSSAS